MKRRNIYLLTILGSFICALIITLSFNNSFSLSNIINIKHNNGNIVYDNEIKSVITESNTETIPGSYILTESGDWINQDEVEVTYTIKTSEKGSIKPTDIILLVPTMYNNDSNYSDQNAMLTNFINEYVDNTNNRIKLVYYTGSEAIQLTDFINDKNALINALSSVTTNMIEFGLSRKYTEGENKYIALKEVENIISSYDKNDDREVKAILMATRYNYCPASEQFKKNYNTGNLYTIFDYDKLAEAEYNILKDMYPFLKIRGVVSQQSERNSSDYSPSQIIHELGYYTDSVEYLYDYKTISDNPFIRATYDYEEYDDFKVEINLSNNYDYTISDYDTGNATIVDNRIIWDSSKKLITGASESLKLIARIKDNNIQPNKYYQISNGTKIISKLYDEDERVLNTNNTTVYKSMYNINYNVNCMDTCNVSSYDTSYVRPYSVINISDKVLSGSDSLFNGWSTGNFIYVETSDVTTNATWTKLSISKSSDGIIGSAVGHYDKDAFKDKTELDNFEFEKAYFINGTESSNPVHNDAVEVFDASIENNGTIVAWIVDEDENGLYEYYVRSKGGVLMPEDASSSFDYNEYMSISYMDVSGMNTSEVVNFSNGFNKVGRNATSLLIEGFDTWNVDNVTNTNSMFDSVGEGNGVTSTSAELKGIETLSFPNLVTANYMFSSFGENAQNVKLKVVINSNSFNSMNRMFYSFAENSPNVDLDISGINTSNVHDMTGLFQNSLNGVTEFDLSMIEDWDVSNAENMSYFFGFALNNIEDIDLSWLYKWNPESVITLDNMFYDFGTNTKKITIDAHGWNMPNATNIKYMLYDSVPNADYAYLNLNDWSIPSVRDYESVFMNIYMNAKDAHIEIDNWDVTNGTNFSSYAYGIGSNSQSLDFSMKNWKVPTALTAAGYYPFYNIGTGSTQFRMDVTGWDLEQSQSIKQLFYGLGNQATEECEFDISGWKNTHNLSQINNLFMNSFWKSNDIVIDLSGWDTHNLTNLSYIVYSVNTSGDTITLDLSDWDFSNLSSSNPIVSNIGNSSSNTSTLNLIMKNAKIGGSYRSYPIAKNLTGAKKINYDVSNWKFINTAQLDGLFYNSFNNAKEVNITGFGTWDTSSIRSIANMFDSFAGSAEKITLGGIGDMDVSNVVVFQKLFYNAGYAVKNIDIDLSNWDVSSGVVFDQMFYFAFTNADSCNIGNLKNWNLSNAATMSSFMSSLGNKTIVDFGEINLTNSTTLMSYSFMSDGLKGNINIRVPLTNAGNSNFVYGSSTLEGSGLTLNYTESSEATVDNLLTAMYSSSHVYKGELLT